MNFKKRLFAGFLAAALSLSLCVTAFAQKASSADPRFSYENGRFTYLSDGKAEGTPSFYHILMVNGTIVPSAGIRVIDGLIYVPVSQTLSLLGATVSEDRESAWIYCYGYNVNIQLGSSIVGVNDMYFDIGAPILSMDQKLYAALTYTGSTQYGSFGVLETELFGFPVVSFEQKFDDDPRDGFTDTEVYQLNALRGVASRMAANTFNEVFDPNLTYGDYLDIFAENPYFLSMGLEDYVTVKETVFPRVQEARYAGIVSRYHYFEGFVSYFVDMYTGDVYFYLNDDGAISLKGLNDVDFTVYLK